MPNILEKVNRKLRLFNCFSYPKHGPAHNEQSIYILNHGKDNLTGADDGSHIERQEVGSNTFQKSPRTSTDLATRVRTAPSVGDRTTLRGGERRDDQEIVHNPQGKEPNPPKGIGGQVGAVGRQRQKIEGERGPSEESRLVMDSIFQGDIQKVNLGNETATKSEEIPVWLSTNTTPTGPEQNSKIAAAPSTAKFSQTSSLSLPAVSRPSGEDTLTLDAPAESGRASSSISPWDAFDRSFPIPGSVSVSADDRAVLPQNESPSRRQQSLLLGLDLTPERARPVLSVISTKAESPAPSVRLRAQSSNDSLSTTSSMSVGSNWEGTVLDMEYKSAKGGEPVYFQAKLDTFARRDAIAENIVKRLGMTWKPDPKGRTFKVIGDRADAGTVIQPLGYITPSLRVVGRQGRLKFKFYVLADSDVGHAFDCLLGCSTTMQNFLALKEESTHQESLTENPLDE